MTKHFSILGRDGILVQFLTLIRGMFIAHALGASLFADAFFAITRIPNLIISIFMEGAFMNTFQSKFSRLFEQDAKSALQFAYRIQLLLILGVITVFIFAELFMEKVLSFLAPGILNHENRETFVMFARIVFPCVLLVPLTSLYCSILYSREEFIYTTLCVSATNIFIIAAILLTGRNDSLLLLHMSHATVLSAILQVILMLYFLERNNMLPISSALAFGGNETSFFKRFFQLALTSEVYQINILISTFFASTVPQGISTLHYADVIIQFLFALIGIKINISLFRSTSPAQDHGKQINRTIEAVLVAIIPTATLLILMSRHIIESFFLIGGKFDIHSAENIANALEVLAFALPAHGLSRVLLQTFVTAEKLKPPIICAIASIAVNIVLNILLIQNYSYVGIAISSCVASWLNTVLMLIYLKRKKMLSLNREISPLLVKIFISASIMILFIQLCGAFLESHPGISAFYPTRLVSMIIICTSSMGIYYFSLSRFRGSRRKKSDTNE